MRVDEIRELIELVERSGIGELELRRGWTSIRIAKQPAPGAASPGGIPVSSASAAVPQTSAAPAAGALTWGDRLERGWAHVREIVGTGGLYVVAGVGLGAGIHVAL